MNHLHDCVITHPNDVGVFYEIVTGVYCSPFMKTLEKDLVFSRLKLDLVGPLYNKIVELEKEFLLNMDGFELTLDTFDPKNCYRYEGAR